jgi:hypothetical protein
VAASDPLAQIPVLYHFTDKSNIPTISQLGGLFSTALLKEMGQAFCAGGTKIASFMMSDAVWIGLSICASLQDIRWHFE